MAFCIPERSFVHNGYELIEGPDRLLKSSGQLVESCQHDFMVSNCDQKRASTKHLQGYVGANRGGVHKIQILIRDLLKDCFLNIIL